MEGSSLCPSFGDFNTARIDFRSKQETSYWGFKMKDSTCGFIFM